MAINKNELATLLAKCSKDPEMFVRTFFEWGSNELTGCDILPWQLDILSQIKDGLPLKQVIKVATASGHGVGKSALVAWLTLWAIATKPQTRGVITANTEGQLRTKTWAEVTKWFNISLLRPLFDMTATAIFSKDKGYEKTWRIDAVTWNENNTEAFAGLHNQGSRLLLIFDEASSIPDAIWEVSEGALTDANTEILWLVFGNPTQNTGRFFECFNRFKNRWVTRKIDSRTVKITNKKQIQEWLEDYGEDSDFFKIRVRGEFPSTSFNQFIGTDLIDRAIGREYTDADVKEFGVIIGADVARFGEDSSAIVVRKGQKILALLRYKGIDTMTFASLIANAIDSYNPDAVFVDQTGVGGGVVDRLVQLNYRVIGVDFGSKALDDDTYFNKRVEMWGDMREWIRNSGSLPDDKELKTDLSSPTFTFKGDNAQILLESKRDMRRRGLESPDAADALALTFAFAVSKVRTNKINLKVRR